jgi:hypothetical protein
MLSLISPYRFTNCPHRHPDHPDRPGHGSLHMPEERGQVRQSVPSTFDSQWGAGQRQSGKGRDSLRKVELEGKERFGVGPSVSHVPVPRALRPP